MYRFICNSSLQKLIVTGILTVAQKKIFPAIIPFMDSGCLCLRGGSYTLLVTLPETNIAPENRPLEKEIPIGNHHFWGLC